MRIRNDLPYDIAYLIKCLMGLACLIGLMYVTSGVGFLAAFVILFTCLSRNNTELLFYTFTMTIAITMGNGNIVHKGAVFGYAQRVLMLTLAGIMIVRIAGSRKSKLLLPLLGLLPYVFYMIIPSVSGWNPVISYLKIFLFLMVYTAYFGVANSVVNSERASAQKIRSIFLMLSIFFIFGSMVLIPFPGLSQMSWEQVQLMIDQGKTVTSLFTGMTFHSQALGPLTSTLGVMLFADLVFSIKRPDKLYLSLLLCVPILIWKTSSRTAMGSFIAGLMFATFFFMRARGIKRGWKSKVVSAIMVVVAGVCLGVIAVPSIRESATSFILKFDKDAVREVTFEEVTSTRRGKWDSAVENFGKKPMTGNGFQVSEDLMGVPAGLTTMSAPVEKGVWLTAVLEEGGVVGMFLFLVFVVATFRALIRYKCYQGLTGFFMLMVTNLGEFTIFSLTATGGLLWAMVFTGIILDAQRMRDEQCMGRMVYYGAY